MQRTTTPTQITGYTEGTPGLLKKVVRIILKDPDQIMGLNYAFAGVLLIVGMLTIARKRIGDAVQSTLTFNPDKFYLRFIAQVKTETGEMVPIVAHQGGALNQYFARMVTFWWNTIQAVANFAGVPWKGFLNLTSPNIEGIAVIVDGKAVEIDLPTMGSVTATLRANRYLDVAEKGDGKIWTLDVTEWIKSSETTGWACTADFGKETKIRNLGTPMGPDQDAYFVTTTEGIELVVTDSDRRLVWVKNLATPNADLPEATRHFCMNGPSIGGGYSFFDGTGDEATVLVLDANVLAGTNIETATALLGGVDYKSDPEISLRPGALTATSRMSNVRGTTRVLGGETKTVPTPSATNDGTTNGANIAG